MNIDTIIIIIAIFAAQSVPLALFLNLSKKIDNMKDEIRILNSKFDLLEERHKTTNIRLTDTQQQINKIETDFKTDIKDLKIEQKEQNTEIKNLNEKVFDILKPKDTAELVYP